MCRDEQSPGRQPCRRTQSLAPSRYSRATLDAALLAGLLVTSMILAPLQGPDAEPRTPAALPPGLAVLLEGAMQASVMRPR